MRIVLFGLGHVGATMAGCLAAAGHAVQGIDPDREVAAAIASGRAPVREPGLDAQVASAVAAGRLTVAQSVGDALTWADLAVVCVATPATASGDLDLAAVLAATRTIAAAIPARAPSAPTLLVLFRSTMPPGTTEEILLPLLATGAGEGPGRRYEVAVNPEFLRQGSAVADLTRPARIVVGEVRAGATRRLRGLYDGLVPDGTPVLEVPFRVAELAKLADNAWHALKVAFANEIGRAASVAGADPAAVMAVLAADPLRNLGPSYLRPGAPYGGSCLDKDLAALVAHAGRGGVPLPLLAGVAASNALHGAWLAARIRKHLPPPGPILQVGLSFKPGTGDLRASPLMDLARDLLRAGYHLLLHDPDLEPAALAAACRLLGPGARPLAETAAVRLVLLGKGELPAGLAGSLPTGTETLALHDLAAC